MESIAPLSSANLLHAMMASPPQVVTSPSVAMAEVSLHANDAQLDQRLAAVLRGLVKGFACDAADFYTLNATSSELNLRAHYRTSGPEPGPQRRTVDSARADVAAMAGNAIVLEDDQEVIDWPVPIWCGAAICLPVSSDQTIYGTLWLYSNEPRTFANAEVELAEVVAGRLAVELELDTLRQRIKTPATFPAPTSASIPAPPPVVLKPAASVVAMDSPMDSPMDSATSDATAISVPTPRAKSVILPTARVLQPSQAPALEEWELAGLAACKLGLADDRFTPADPQQLSASSPARRSNLSHFATANGYFDWQTFPDGRTLVATGSMLEGAVDVAMLHSARIALRAHAPESTDAGELLTRVNHTLWMASPGGEGVAIALALLDSDGEHASVAMAGAAAALRWKASTHDLLTASSAPVGWSEQSIYVARHLDLMVRERLVFLAAPQ